MICNIITKQSFIFVSVERSFTVNISKAEFKSDEFFVRIKDLKTL